MEFNNHPTNSSSDASHASAGAQPNAFNWQNPTFAMPNPRARPSSTDRVPGSVHSSRPRWTPAKHARILAQIKATRTDMDPSFPRAVPVPETAGQASAQSQVKGALHNLAQSTKSYFDSLTEYAIEQFYGSGSPAAASGDPLRADRTEQKKKFVAHLVGSGLSDQQAMDVVMAWTAAGIPVSTLTLPVAYKEKYAFQLSDRERSKTSGASILDYVDADGKAQILKCFPPPSEVDLSGFSEVTGIDVNEPKRELRNLLASHIAHEILQWDIVPQASLAFVSGKVCVISPRIEGSSLKNIFDNNLSMRLVYTGAWQDGAVHTATWKDHFGEGFRQDYLRLSLFSMLVGDADRHLGQFITKGKQPNFLRGLDWDAAFGSKITNDEIYMTAIPGKLRSLWPDSVPQTIADEFGKVTEANLKEAGVTYGLSDAEVTAMLSRFGVIKKKLAALKKT